MRCRALTASRTATAHLRTGSAYARSIVADGATAVAGRARSALRSANPAMRLLRLPCRPGRLRVPVCGSHSTSHTSGQLLGNTFCAFFPRLRVPFVFRTGRYPPNGTYPPPPPSPLNRPPCIGPHATVPASFAERVCPCFPREWFAMSRLSDCPLALRLKSQFRAKPPANPMDIACPGSSDCPGLLLIRFIKRPLQSAVCDRKEIR